MAGGWRLAYQPEPLADGLGPEDGRSYVSQQRRWATGCLELLFRRRALWWQLPRAQRWQYLVATSCWLSGWTILVYLALPFFALTLGWRPVSDTGAFAVHFLPYFLAAVINLSRFTSGSYTLRGLAMNWGSFAIHIHSTIRAISGREHRFAVTAKRGASELPWALIVPNGTALVLLAGAIAAGARAGLTPSRVNNISFAAVDATLVSLIVVYALAQARALRARAALEAPAPAAPAVASPRPQLLPQLLPPALPLPAPGPALALLAPPQPPAALAAVPLPPLVLVAAARLPLLAQAGARAQLPPAPAAEPAAELATLLRPRTAAEQAPLPLRARLALRQVELDPRTRELLARAAGIGLLALVLLNVAFFTTLRCSTEETSR